MSRTIMSIVNKVNPTYAIECFRVHSFLIQIDNRCIFQTPNPLHPEITSLLQQRGGIEQIRFSLRFPA